MERGFLKGFITHMAPLAASLGFFYAAAILPPLGLLAPAPLYWALVVYGPSEGLFLTAAAAAVTLAVGGIGHFIFFSVSCGIMAFSLARSYWRRDSLERTLFFAAFAPFAAGAMVIAFIIFSNTEGAPAGGLAGLADELGRAVTESYRNIEPGGEAAAWLAENGRWLAETLVRTFPALALMSVTLMAAVNMMVIRAVSLKAGWGIHPVDHSLSAFRAPDALVWAVVAGGFGALFFEGVAGAAALNVLLIALTVYAIQGVAVIHAFFMKSNIPILLRALGYFIIFSHPLTMGLVSALGLMDVWADFRKGWPRSA